MLEDEEGLVLRAGYTNATSTSPANTATAAFALPWWAWVVVAAAGALLFVIIAMLIITIVCCLIKHLERKKRVRRGLFFKSAAKVYVKPNLLIHLYSTNKFTFIATLTSALSCAGLQALPANNNQVYYLEIFVFRNYFYQYNCKYTLMNTIIDAL